MASTTTKKKIIRALANRLGISISHAGRICSEPYASQQLNKIDNIANPIVMMNSDEFSGGAVVWGDNGDHHVEVCGIPVSYNDAANWLEMPLEKAYGIPQGAVLGGPLVMLEESDFENFEEIRFAA